MTDPMNQQITLCDGRTLGFAECSDLAGTPVLLFKGAAARPTLECGDSGHVSATGAPLFVRSMPAAFLRSPETP